MKPLPPSSDKDFWGDADVQRIEVPKITVPSEHQTVEHLGVLICRSCSNRHTLTPLDRGERKP